MRNGLLALATLVVVGLSQGWFARAYDAATTAALSDDARLALEVGCEREVGFAARECRAMLKKLYLAGRLDPDKTLRAYCDSGRAEWWGGRRPAPPAVCVQRYGGWRAG